MLAWWAVRPGRCKCEVFIQEWARQNTAAGPHCIRRASPSLLVLLMPMV